jgi:hypothetical protein
MIGPRRGRVTRPSVLDWVTAYLVAAIAEQLLLRMTSLAAGF